MAENGARNKRSERLWYVIIALIAIAAGYLYFLNYRLSNSSLPPSTPTQPLLSQQKATNRPSLTPTPTITPTPRPRKLDGGKLFNLINEYRTRNGLSELLWYHPLCEFAKERSQQVKDDWSHEGYQKEAMEGALYTSVCPECGKTGENLAQGYHSEEAALEGWIGSQSHKKNLDADWDWGCAMYYSNNYVSILFGKKR